MNDTSDTISILHVDDEPDFGDMVAEFLKREDERFRVVTAATAEEGLEHVEKHAVDCVVSDHDMPGQNGIEFLHEVRDTHPDIPFILYTGKGSEEIASEAISAGVTDYLQKQSGSDQYTILANRIRNAVEQARAQRDRDRQLDAIESAREGISLLDADGRFTYVNQSYADLYGYEPDDMIGEHWEMLYPADDARRMHEEILPTVWERGYWHGETRGMRADGSTFIEDHVLSVTEDDQLVCAVRDVTDQRERRQELKEYRNILEAAGDGVYALDLDGRYTMVNDRLVEMTGYERAELVGSHASLLLDEADIEEGRKLIRRLLKGDQTVAEHEETIHTADGGEFVAESRITLVHDDDGTLQGTAGIIRDITAKKRREAELERYETILEAVGDPVYALNADGEYTYVNEAFVRQTGYSREEILGESVSTVLSERDAERGREIIRELLASDATRQATWEMHRTTADGEEVPTENHLALLPEGETGEFQGTVGVVRDISERKERERQLERQKSELESVKADLEDQYRRLFEEAPMMAIVVRYVAGAEGPIIVDSNSQFAERLGYPKSDIVGREIADFYTPESREQLLDKEQFDRAETEGFSSDRRRLVTKEGDIVETILRAVPGRSAPGGEAGKLAIYVDITEQEEIRQANERLEEFTGVVSHDLRNPLTVAQGRLELAQAECESDHLAAVENALERSQGLIDDLLTLAREGERVSDIEPVDFEAFAERCWENVATGQASIHIAADRCIHADETRLKQLLENLFRNAVDHGGEGVNVTVGALPDGFYVEDDGPGIPDEASQAVFEAGYTTAAEGTGFGLSIVKRVANAHDWRVDVTRSAGGGARFEITGVAMGTADTRD